MVAPSSSSRSGGGKGKSGSAASASGASSSEPRDWIILTVKVLFVLIILFMLPRLVLTKPTRHRQRQKRNLVQIRAIRAQCALETCSQYVPEESFNCVFACMSPACQQLVYGDDPLEDGQVDPLRGREFDDCVKGEFHDLAQRKQRSKELF